MISTTAEAATQKPIVVIETSEGAIWVQLYPDKAPATVDNFLRYVDSDFYTKTIFHRVMAGFMIQGGGFDENLRKKMTNRPVKYEGDNGLSNKRGTIAMARTNDPNSATAQFYINLVDNPSLDHKMMEPGYTVFGKVVRGLKVVQKIGSALTGQRKGYSDVPRTPIFIEKVYRLKR
ncbi:MAG: peptidylprolyl isomerase [Desulfovibrio sp.]